MIKNRQKLRIHVGTLLPFVKIEYIVNEWVSTLQFDRKGYMCLWSRLLSLRLASEKSRRAIHIKTFAEEDEILTRLLILLGLR